MQIEPGRVPHRIAGADREHDEDERDRQAAERGDVLGEDDQQLALARAAKPAPERPACRAPCRPRAGTPQSETPSAPMPNARIAIAIHALLDRLGGLHLVDALVDRERPPMLNSMMATMKLQK